LLGSNRDAQQIATTLAESGNLSPEIERQLTIGRLAQRDYAGALEHVRRSLANRQGQFSDLNLLLYLLAKNGQLEEAKAALAGVSGSQPAEFREFRQWFEVKFGLREAELGANRVK
jgi:Flp pilus assembly protein TadD